MDRAGHAAALGRDPAQRLGVVGAAQLDDPPPAVPDDFVASNREGVLEPYLAARTETVEARRRILGEVAALDVDLATQRQVAVLLRAVVGARHRRGPKRLQPARVEVRQHDSERVQDAEGARCPAVEVVAYRELELAVVDTRLGPGDADHLAEAADRLGGDTTPPEPGNGRHAGVVPAPHRPRSNELLQPAFAGDDVLDDQGCELGLLGTGELRIHPCE